MVSSGGHQYGHTESKRRIRDVVEYRNRPVAKVRSPMGLRCSPSRSAIFPKNGNSRIRVERASIRVRYQSYTVDFGQSTVASDAHKSVRDPAEEVA